MSKIVDLSKMAAKRTCKKQVDEDCKEVGLI